MTKIHVKTQEGQVRIVAEGHANAKRNEDGRDLVCCAISTLLYTLANSLHNMEGVHTTFETREGDGRAELNAWTNEAAVGYGLHERAQVIIDGLEAMAEQYPQCVQVTVDNC